MKNLILMSLLIAFSFSVNANELKIGNTGLVLKNRACIGIDDLGTHVAMGYFGHLVNRGEKKMTGLVCLLFFDKDGDHLGTCGSFVSLKSKRGKSFRALSTHSGILCPCKGRKSVSTHFIKQDSPKQYQDFTVDCD